MPYQELYIDQSYEIYQEILDKAISQHLPSDMDTFLGYADQAYMYSPAALALNILLSFKMKPQ